MGKVAVRQEVARGHTFIKSNEVCAFLQQKLVNTKVDYHIVEMTEETLEEARQHASHKVFKRVVGSNSFQVIMVVYC